MRLSGRRSNGTVSMVHSLDEQCRANPDSLSSGTSGRQICVENRGFNDLSPASIIDANCTPEKL
uniref:Uncharacterized protein n=1 Tax=Hyaloperonospora arabidopsidis (strain Emoy2) TaxID=559515 RepID=M4B2X8_HYAAE